MKRLAALMMTTFCVTCGVAAQAAPADAKLAWTTANDKAANDFKLARARCDVLTGNPKDVCIVEAKAARVYLEANAKARYKNSLASTTDARKAIADADYEVEKTRCASLTGNPKDVCLKESKANLVAALADAKADRKIGEARADAQEDKRSADYKVALEKCDAYAGAPQKACVADVKAQFGK
ncbi:MAG: hypothetical protein H7234_05690 [Herminiimonas sp.]|nr:hypothetical protein [Herminiimonas sp.]